MLIPASAVQAGSTDTECHITYVGKEQKLATLQLDFEKLEVKFD